MSISKENMTATLQRISEKFHLDGEWKGYEEISIGHINNTYRVDFMDDSGKIRSYMMQQINMFVFKNPRIIMHNIDLATGHIREKNPKAALHFHHTADGKNYYVEGGSFWRTYTYVDGLVIDGGATEVGMESAGRAFGDFQMYLSDFDASLLKEPIPGFHNTKQRFKTLFCDMVDDPCGRVEFVHRELEWAQKIQPQACKLIDMLEKGELPLRVTHNDTKTNNVLLDKNTSNPICVIDLDTIMPGLVMYDFGDAIRYGANKSAEDEKNLNKVGIDLDLFKAFAKGFVGKTASVLTENEIEYMAFGSLVMTVECGIRFLDDYIVGDSYFRISYPTHNLVRARNQFKLADDMLLHMDEMNQIVRDIYKESI